MRKPKIELYWTPVPHTEGGFAYFVNWRLVGANGELMCSSNQGYRDKTDVLRSVRAVMYLLAAGADDDGTVAIGVRIVGPGKRPE